MHKDSVRSAAQLKIHNYIKCFWMLFWCNSVKTLLNVFENYLRMEPILSIMFDRWKVCQLSFHLWILSALPIRLPIIFTSIVFTIFLIFRHEVYTSCLITSSLQYQHFLGWQIYLLISVNNNHFFNNPFLVVASSVEKETTSQNG